MFVEPQQLDKRKVEQLEFSEAAYWQNYHEHCPPETKTFLGLDQVCTSRYHAFANPRYDVLALNRVLCAGLEEPLTPEVIDELILFYQDREIPRFFVQVAPGGDEEHIQQMLTQAGFRHHNNWAKLGRELNNLPGMPQTRLVVREAGIPDKETVGEVLAASFDFPTEMAGFFSGTIGLPHWKYFLAFDGKTPVAAAGLHLFGRTASLSIAGTLPAARGKGAQKALIVARMQAAARYRCRYIKVETAQDNPEKPAQSYRNMLKCGFTPIYLRPNYIYEMNHADVHNA